MYSGNSKRLAKSLSFNYQQHHSSTTLEVALFDGGQVKFDFKNKLQPINKKYHNVVLFFGSLISTYYIEIISNLSKYRGAALC
jgi:hypothetical protein